MMPLGPLQLMQPKNLLELKSILKHANEKTRLISGGTDLLPNLKNGLYDCDQLISLKKISDLKNIQIENNSITLGANVKLSEVAENQEIKSLVKGVCRAAEQIASPQIRNMGTVGGNICLDTRCTYFNQSAFWRKSLGFCIKKDGELCHVTKTGKRCVAAASNDLATMLLALNAQIKILDGDHINTINLNDFYINNGEKNNILKPGQVVLSTSFKRSENLFTGFSKLRHRESIDYSMLTCAVAITIDKASTLKSGSIAINAMLAKPKVIDLSEFAEKPFDHKLCENIAASVSKKCHPQTNIFDDTTWRKQMVPVFVMKALKDAYQFSL